MSPEIIQSALSDSHRRTAEMVAEAAGKDPVIFRHILTFCWEKPYPVSMRAARVVEFCCEANPDILLPYLDEVLEKFPSSPVVGVRRGFLKVFSGHFGLSHIAEPGPLLNLCFDRMVDINEAYAIRVYAMEIIYRYCQIEPDLKPELKSTIEFILEEAPPSIRSRGRRILKKI